MKVAIITGAGSGIGLGCAEALAAQGCAVLGVGRDADKLARVHDVVADPDRSAVLAQDVTAADAPARIVEAALARWGRIDFLINNAGVGSPKPLLETDDDQLDAILSLMLKAPFRLAREVIPHMAAGSAVISVSSTYAIVGGLRGGAYSAAKAGLWGLTSHIAVQYGPRGVRANVVAPGVIRTPMTEARFEDERFVRMNRDMTPHTRLGEVGDVAGTVAFLCSEQGSFINGQTIAVDGGWSTTKYLSDRALSARWVHDEDETAE
jgi:NAD(P)-dependent dehydrogenase (short-subunit alcohol dehydrogenase family)